MPVIRKILLIPAFAMIGSLHGAPAPQNNITIVVSDGPFAGSYSTTETACLHVKDRNTLGCGWKAFTGHAKTKTLEEAGIQVDRVSEGPGARTGDVIVKFLEGGSETMQDYSVNNVPLTLSRTGTVQVISFDGKSKNGMHMRVTGTLVQVDEF